MSDTELRLMVWRDGSTQAERLAASILRLAGYEEIDPQAPLGGPDGGKDIVCSKGGVMWICAVYFPTTAVNFTAVKRKFLSDLAKVDVQRRGFAFVTNRPLTLTQNDALKAAGTAAGKEVDIFPLERMRTLLDQPSGYGVRLQFLRIAMSTEDQLSWFAESDDRVLNALNLNTRELLGIKAIIKGLAKDSSDIVRTMSQLGAITPATPDLLSTSNFAAPRSRQPISSAIDVSFILFTHRMSCFDMPTRTVGVLRTDEVWLANSEAVRAKHVQPPRVSEVPSLVEEICSTWREGFYRLATAGVEQKIEAIAQFHSKLLVIHPFLDGNGRVARALLMQQCLDLFGIAKMSLLEQGASYYRALAAADNGDIDPLVSIVRPVVGK